MRDGSAGAGDSTRSFAAAAVAGRVSEVPASYLGIDIGSETVKLVELTRVDGALRRARGEIVEHDKAPEAAVIDTSLVQFG